MQALPAVSVLVVSITFCHIRVLFWIVKTSCQLFVRLNRFCHSWLLRSDSSFLFNNFDAFLGIELAVYCSQTTLYRLSAQRSVIVMYLDAECFTVISKRDVSTVSVTVVDRGSVCLKSSYSAWKPVSKMISFQHRILRNPIPIALLRILNGSWLFFSA